MRRNLAFLVAGLGAGLLLHRTLTFLAPLLPKLVWQGPLWVQIPGVFLIAELFNWALHWAKHKNAYLWRFHCQHHREDHYTVWLITHTYAPEVLLSGTIIGSVIIVAGFDPWVLDLYLLFYSLVNLYQHSAHPYSLGWLDSIIINPAYHRHHHGGDQVNFGSTLSVWDWVFGTVAWPKDRFVAINPPPIEASPEPFGFVDEMLYPLIPSRWRLTGNRTERA
jgi:sterol desaturase/sphingolipid hydroxylase (fatty acid hydroxylase superfamily)